VFDELPKQKWVFKGNGLPWYCGCKRLLFWCLAGNKYWFLNVRLLNNCVPNMQVSLRRMSWKCVMKCELLIIADLDGQDIILCNIVRFSKSPMKSELEIWKITEAWD
jgi:hypothetical protein